MTDAALLLAIATACVLGAAGPLSGFARAYLGELVSRQGGMRIRRLGLLSPLTQGLLAGACCAITAWWGWRLDAIASTAVALPTVTILAVACSVDALSHRLPNRLLGWAALWLAGTILIRCAWALATGESWSQALRPAGTALGTACAGMAVMVVLCLLPTGMGLGDAKLIGVLGLWLGHASAWSLVTALMLGFVLGGLAALGLLALGRAGRKDSIAFGPYLAIGGLLSWALSLS
ncbi:prepilin peptidase [Actinomyces slackii]|uniref:Flp pilus assembly protein, protease CpaA n=1 Tax=Actinomyces slackii TaxID=52774 RepID=A0A448KGF9_9ACTO|nr:prepilin peptidase [Actinomyces slackii]VEG75990.1 Flp pilus assembly protein, protease CpaA [Actinomyces slackii]